MRYAPLQINATSDLSKALSILLFSLLFFACTYAQDATWKNYTIRDGLPHSNVYRIFQDRKGFLWLSTDFGICSFDGHAFRSDFNDPLGLLNTSVLSISETQRGTKLISTAAGLLEFTDSAIRPIPIAGSKPKIFVYAQERDSKIWMIATYPGTSTKRVCELQNGQLKFHDLRGANNELAEFNTLVSCKDELIFCGTQGLFSVKNNIVLQLFPSLIHEPVTDVAKDSLERYWIGLKDRIVLIAGDKKLQEIILPNNKHVNNIFLDRQGQLWVSLIEGGMLKIQDGKAQDIPSLHAIQSTIINDIFQDFEGNIWLATYGSGLYMLNAMNILDYTSGSNIPTVFSKSIDLVNNEVWISSIGKILKLDSGLLKPVSISQLKSHYYTYFSQQIGRKVYIGTAFGLITKSLDPPYSEQIADSGVISICADSKGRIWAGGYKAVYLIINDKPIRHPVSDRINQRVNRIVEDHNGNIWCGTGHGIYIFDPDHWQQPKQLLEKLHIIQDIKEDARHRMWIASSNGLACVSGDSIKTFTKEDGLAGNNVNCVLPGKDVLWVGTSGGLNYVDLNTMQVKALTPVVFKDVILSLCSRNDELFIGTANSIYSIKLDEPAKDNSAPPVFITQVKVHGQRLSWPQSVNLPYKDNGLQIGYIGLSYQAAHLIEYRYRISGLEDAWHYTNNNLVDIPSLPSGNYTFILNARKNHGEWSRNVTLTITVGTPFFKTWWFFIAVVVILGTALFLVTRRYTMVQEKKKRNRLVVYNKMAYLKQQALSALINPHFIFNCMNSIQHFLNSNDPDKANEYLADFAQLIRMTLEDAQESFLSLDKEISRIRLYLLLEQLRFGHKLQYAIDVDPAIDVKATRIPNMILQPYVENAIWHGIMPKEESGRIDIRFTITGTDELSIAIVDDGAGMPLEAINEVYDSKQHYGVRLTKERLQLLRDLSGQHYEISITNLSSTSSQKGTEVKIILPLHPQENLEDLKQ